MTTHEGHASQKSAGEWKAAYLEALAQRDELAEALRGTSRFLDAFLCPFGTALRLDTCDCNYHDAAKVARAALAALEREP